MSTVFKEIKLLFNHWNDVQVSMKLKIYSEIGDDFLVFQKLVNIFNDP